MTLKTSMCDIDGAVIDRCIDRLQAGGEATLQQRAVTPHSALYIAHTQCATRSPAGGREETCNGGLMV